LLVAAPALDEHREEVSTEWGLRVGPTD
jgi:hypothetical protein